MNDDKRLIPEFVDRFWSQRASEKSWHYCKYCSRETPTFVFSEGLVGDLTPLQVMRCCWECGGGLKVLEHTRFSYCGSAVTTTKEIAL